MRPLCRSLVWQLKHGACSDMIPLTKRTGCLLADTGYPTKKHQHMNERFHFTTRLCLYRAGGNSVSGQFRGGGGNFVRGKFRHTSNFGAGPSDTVNIDTASNLWFLVDNPSCETSAGPNFEQHQIIRDENKRARPPEDAQRARSAPNCTIKFRGKNFGTKLKNETKKRKP